MKDKTFKPMLAENQQPELESLNFPQFCSRKMDGIRIIFYKGQILSRSLKEIPNKQLKQKFEDIRKYSEDNNCILDGEVYSPQLTFQQIISFTMTEDFEDKKSIKKFGKVMEIPEHLMFNCFDYLRGQHDKRPFNQRIEDIYAIQRKFYGILNVVDQFEVNNKEELEDFFKQALELGYEGLILKNPNGEYKFGRTTLKENLMYKLKPFETFDAQITGVVQSTEVNDEAIKTINELGRSVTSKKIGERHLINKASAFFVNYEGKELKVVLAMTDPEKEAVWVNREKYIGKWIEYKGMLIGSKDVPRHPVMTRFREDKDDNSK